MEVPEVQRVGAHLPEVGGLEAIGARLELDDEDRLARRGGPRRAGGSGGEFVLEHDRPVLELRSGELAPEHVDLLAPRAHLRVAVAVHAGRPDPLDQSAHEGVLIGRP